MTNHGPYSENKEARLRYFTAYIGDTMPHLTHQSAVELAKEYVRYFQINYVTNILEIAEKEEIETLKYFIVSDHPDQLATLSREIRNKFPDIIVTSSGTYNIEATNKHAQKGIALLKLAEKYGFKPEEIMAIGDSANDSSMLSLAGISVAMQNATTNIKELSRFETTSNEKSGVAQAIWNVLNGNWK
jgi:Cof subfamily protein (haloacid dehalogenase superfamily)